MKNKENLIHYLPLFGLLFFGFFAFWLFSFDILFKTIVIILVAVAYVVWGAYHHKKHGDLNWMVVVEYALIAFLGLTIIFSLLYRS